MIWIYLILYLFVMILYRIFFFKYTLKRIGSDIEIVKLDVEIALMMVHFMFFISFIWFVLTGLRYFKNKKFYCYKQELLEDKQYYYDIFRDHNGYTVVIRYQHLFKNWYIKCSSEELVYSPKIYGFKFFSDKYYMNDFIEAIDLKNQANSAKTINKFML